MGTLATDTVRRSDFGVVKLGAYISVGTGKYPAAPWLARRLVDGILD